MSNYSHFINQSNTPFELIDLPFDIKDFKNHLSDESFEFHHKKHHKTYVKKLNALLLNNNEYKNLDLESIIIKSYKKDNAIFNNSAQVWNHNFFWYSISAKKQTISSKLKDLIDSSFGSFDEFKNSHFKL